MTAHYNQRLTLGNSLPVAFVGIFANLGPAAAGQFSFHTQVPLMSNRSALAALVQSKLTAARKRADETSSSAKSSLDASVAKTQVLFDYQLYFQGVGDALEALNVDADEARPVILAVKSIELDIAAEENRQALERELLGDTEA